MKTVATNARIWLQTGPLSRVAFFSDIWQIGPRCYATLNGERVQVQENGGEWVVE